MICKECGKELGDSVVICPICGTSTKGQNLSKEGEKKKYLCCPVCKSRNIKRTVSQKTEVHSTGGGYSTGCGCCGLMAFGPLGLLCGLGGNTPKTTVVNKLDGEWVCHDCGETFQSLKQIDELIDANKRVNSILLRTCISILVLFIISVFSTFYAGIDFYGIICLALMFSGLMIFGAGYCVYYTKVKELKMKREYIYKNAYR